MGRLCAFSIAADRKLLSHVEPDHLSALGTADQFLDAEVRSSDRIIATPSGCRSGGSQSPVRDTLVSARIRTDNSSPLSCRLSSRDYSPMVEITEVGMKRIVMAGLALLAFAVPVHAQTAGGVTQKGPGTEDLKAATDTRI